ncbi:MAG: WG repeat-containing protein [bacterium]|nr:WG repeat-containing protein [bacterium]
MNKYFFTSFILVNFVIKGFNQDICSVYHEAVEISNSNFNGTVIIDPKGPINIHVEYVSPTEDVKYKMETFAYLLGINKDANFVKLTDQEKEEYILRKMKAFSDRQDILNREKKGIALAREELKNAEKELRNKLSKQKEELANMVDQARNQPLSTVLKEKLTELETQTNQIITSTENCLLNDFEPVSIKDIETGEIVYAFSLEAIKNDPNYVFIDDYSEGFARVKRNNKFGFYNAEGKLIIPFKYDYAGSFGEGKAIVKNLGKWFFINSKGENILELPKKFQYVDGIERIFPKVYKCTSSGKTFYLHLNDGDQFLKIEDIRELSDSGISRFTVLENYRSKYGILNDQGRIVLPATYDKIHPYQEGLYTIQENTKYGVVNEKGVIIVPVKYQKIDRYSKFEEHGIIEAEIERYTWDVYSATGKLIISHGEYSSYQLLDDFIRVNRKGNYGVLDLQGEQVLPCEYASIVYESYPKQFIAEAKGHYGVLDTQGNIIIPFKYTYIEKFYIKNYRVREKSGEAGIISSEGKIIVPVQFSDIEMMDFLIKARLDQKYFFYNLSGEELLSNQEGAPELFIASPDQGRIHRFGDTYFRRNQNDFYFLTLQKGYDSQIYLLKNKEARFILVGTDIAFNYKLLKQLDVGVYYLYDYGNNGIILFDSTISKAYHDIRPENIKVDKNRNIIINGAREEYRSGYSNFVLNAKLEKITEGAYGEIHPCPNGMYLVENRWYVSGKGKSYSTMDYLDKNGQRITNERFEFAEPFDVSNTAIVGNSNKKYGVIDQYGAEIVILNFDEVIRIKNGFLLKYQDYKTFKVDLKGKCMGADCNEYSNIVKVYHSQD